MVQIGKYLLVSGNGRTNYIIAGGYETMPAEYLLANKQTYILLDKDSLQNLPLQTSPQLFVFPAGDNSNAITEVLKAKYPNGTLTPHYSSFDNTLLFYSFEVR